MKTTKKKKVVIVRLLHVTFIKIALPLDNKLPADNYFNSLMNKIGSLKHESLKKVRKETRKVTV